MFQFVTFLFIIIKQSCTVYSTVVELINFIAADVLLTYLPFTEELTNFHMHVLGLGSSHYNKI